jgi:pSer/pThr/pTyr-binding forkhead associated (FHA) protein
LPPFVLTVLKVVFLALLYFFVYRAIRAAWTDVRLASARPARPGRTQARAEPARTGRGTKPPKTVVIMDDKGSKVGSHTLDGQLQIGRADACQIHLTDTYASQFHARLFQRDGTWFVEDLGSTNGTFLNQRKITAPAEVRAGDRIRIGKTTLELRR